MSIWKWHCGRFLHTPFSRALHLVWKNYLMDTMAQPFGYGLVTLGPLARAGRNLHCRPYEWRSRPIVGFSRWVGTTFVGSVQSPTRVPKTPSRVLVTNWCGRDTWG